MKTFVYYFYLFARVLVKIICNVFYPNTVFKNKETLNFDHPAILISNHPNSLLDAVGVAGRAKYMVFFLANAGMFSTRFTNWFFTNFYCIKIERPKDVEGRRIQNSKSFEMCDNHLTNGGILYIAPQGLSQNKRRLDTFKTGTARIALSAESKNDFKLGLTIIPVGLNYSAPRNYGSDLFFNVGTPIKIDGFKNDYQSDPISTAKQVTAHLENKMKELIIDTLDEEEDALIKKVEIIQQTENPLTIDHAFTRSKKTIEQLRLLKETAPQKHQLLDNQLKQYFTEVDQHKINDVSLATESKESSSSKYIARALLLILGFPFFLYGWFNNLMAYKIPLFMVKKLNVGNVYDSAIKTLIGLITFPLFYLLQICLVHSIFQQPVLTILYAVSLYPLGRLAWKYKELVQKFKLGNRVKKYFRKNSTASFLLLAKRKKIVQQLEDLAISSLPKTSSSS